jgi:hypothetical protein
MGVKYSIYKTPFRCRLIQNPKHFKQTTCSNLSTFSLQTSLLYPTMKPATLTITLFSLLPLSYAIEIQDNHEDQSQPVLNTDHTPSAEIPIQERSVPATTPSTPNGPPICCNNMAQGWQWIYTACATAASQHLALVPNCYIAGHTCRSLECYGEAEIYFCNDVRIELLLYSPLLLSSTHLHEI